MKTVFAPIVCSSLSTSGCRVNSVSDTFSTFSAKSLCQNVITMGRKNKALKSELTI